MSKNKYQEALDRRKEAFENMFNVLEIEKDNKFYEDIELLQELVDRAILQKPSIWGDGYDEKGELIYDMYDCLNCEESYEIDYHEYDYCPKCGQKLDFSEEEEDE